MLMLISPAKTLDYSTPPTSKEYSLPHFTDQVQQLVEILQAYSPADLASLMKISDKLAGLNAARFTQWQSEFTPDNAKQALLAFKGDVYTGLDAQSLSADDLQYAQKHLRILSGLYGVLRPLDLMQAYRLEMGCKLSNPAGTDLYRFWGEQITRHLNQYIEQCGFSNVLNLASNEYFKSVKVPLLQANLINVDFKDLKNGAYKTISFYAKKARGMMVRHVLQQRISSVQQLQGFNSAGYYFSQEQSTPNHLVFLRDHAQES